MFFASTKPQGITWSASASSGAVRAHGDVLLVRRSGNTEKDANIAFDNGAPITMRSPWGKWISTRIVCPLTEGSDDIHAVLIPHCVSGGGDNLVLNYGLADGAELSYAVLVMPPRGLVNGPTDDSGVVASVPGYRLGADIVKVNPFSLDSDRNTAMILAHVGRRALHFVRNFGDEDIIVYLLPPLDREQYNIAIGQEYGGFAVEKLKLTQWVIPADGRWYVAIAALAVMALGVAGCDGILVEDPSFQFELSDDWAFVTSFGYAALEWEPGNLHSLASPSAYYNAYKQVKKTGTYTIRVDYTKVDSYYNLFLYRASSPGAPDGNYFFDDNGVSAGPQSIEIEVDLVEGEWIGLVAQAVKAIQITYFQAVMQVQGATYAKGHESGVMLAESTDGIKLEAFRLDLI